VTASGRSTFELSSGAGSAGGARLDPLASPGPADDGAARLPMPVITGCPRSGTSLLAVMLDSHSQVAMPPETLFLNSLERLPGDGDSLRRNFFELVTCDQARISNWSDLDMDKDEFQRRLEGVRPFSLTDGLRTFYAQYAQRHGKPRCGEKTPTNNVVYVGGLLPEAHFLHIIRDPRDTVLSLRRTWFGAAQELSAIAETWVQRVAAGRAASRSVLHYHELRYEDLVLAPEPVLRAVCSFLSLEFEPAMLDYAASGAARIASLTTRKAADGKVVATREERAGIHVNLARPPIAERVGVWERELGADERQCIEAVTGPLMRELGYGS
jgi:Sulfotransferase family